MDPPPPLPPPLPMFEVDSQNHLEERSLGQVQVRAPYNPLFGVRSRSIPQGMILDAQPLVKSLSCPTKPSPNGFLDFEASIPLKLDDIFEGDGGGAGWAGGQKFVLRRI